MIQLGFLGNINTSIQLGDIAYYVDTTADGGFTQNVDSSGSSNDPIILGPITSINNDATSMTVDGVVITVDYILEVTESEPITPPTSTSFVFFTKDNNVNVSQMRGYYGEVEFKNNSTVKAEMFSATCEVVESSK